MAALTLQVTRDQPVNVVDALTLAPGGSYVLLSATPGLLKIAEAANPPEPGSLAHVVNGGGSWQFSVGPEGVWVWPIEYDGAVVIVDH